MTKYQILVNILDRIRAEAPARFRSYYPPERNLEKVNQARSRAFIHLFLKVKLGLLGFLEREELITDAAYDGGIDAYYVDQEKRRIYFIQSKFRSNANTFEEKDISLNEILKMDIDRVLGGETTDENGNKYNGKIQDLIRQIQQITDIGRYSYEIILLANLKGITAGQLRRLVPGYPVTAFNFAKCYDELVFPIVSGTYYSASDLYININLSNREYSGARVSYPVTTRNSECEITLLFVPTLEIARHFHKYKNSILKFNPRSYLSLSKNQVNREIARTIRDLSTNEFSLFNNGITLLSDETRLQEKVGRKDRGQLYVKNPQIINGGQTAYTLSYIYEEAQERGEDIEALFDGKEVMLKVITFADVSSRDQVKILIEQISRSTNRQTPVDEADRRSNDAIQVELQTILYTEFGYFYERKYGEFYDGLRNHYIDRSRVIDRTILLRMVYAMKGFPSQARSGSNTLFKPDRIGKILDNIEDAPRILFAYLCSVRLESLKKKYNKSKINKFGAVTYGNALRWGQPSVIYVSSALLNRHITAANIDALVESHVDAVIDRWLEFETFVQKQKHNKRYFIKRYDLDGNVNMETNFDGYYKGETLKRDLNKFFKIKGSG